MTTEVLFPPGLPIVEEPRLQGFNDRMVRGTRPALDALLALFAAAQEQRLPLIVVSSYRSYEAQRRIWTDKFNGVRPILDDRGNALSCFGSEEERCEAMTRWSAPPGLSRHHWGTDFDIFLRRPVEEGYQLRLTPDEFAAGGICHALDSWLASDAPQFGFHRPYCGRSPAGVGQEPWHISYRPQADSIRSNVTAESLLRLWDKHPFPGSDWAKRHVNRLISQFLQPEGDR